VSETVPGMSAPDSDLPPPEEGVHGEHGHYYRKRRRRRKKRMSRRKLRYALVMAIVACIGIAYLLIALNDPRPTKKKLDPDDYRKGIGEIIKKK
jgi:hypothetical protein